MRLLITIVMTCAVLCARAQCLCGDVVFNIELPGYAEDTTRYRLRKLEIDGSTRDTYGGTIPRMSRLPYVHEHRYGYLELRQPTGDGLESVTWEVTDGQTGAVMRVTALHMYYDTPYEVDLLPFTPGEFVFDWAAIPTKALPEKDRLDGRIWLPASGHLSGADLELFRKHR